MAIWRWRASINPVLKAPEPAYSDKNRDDQDPPPFCRSYAPARSSAASKAIGKIRRFRGPI